MSSSKYYNEEMTSRPSSKQRLSPIINEVSNTNTCRIYVHQPHV